MSAIVVGVDGSTIGRAAVSWALDRAAELHHEIVLVHVVDDEWGTVGLSARRELRTMGEITLADALEFARVTQPAVSIRGEIAEGVPMMVLAERSESAELVAVGTHKAGFVRGQVFGSQSLQLAATSRAPLAVIPQVPYRSRRGGIAVGVDDSVASLRALEFAAREAARTREQLTLFRCIGARDHGAVSDAVIERAMDTAELIVGARPRARMVQRPPAEALVEATRMMSLVVIGRPTRVWGGQRGLGHVAHDVLLNMAGPVIVVPEPE
ncbi:universal stress protein [Herbiconiux ginsengi]|uniref:Nucleotide-binding universal stress protein, UspA family n=1 Tax=Herbiconiux ginsengi TaxID=381665 RepID=A0A1H3SXS5_9MICO|nr:universal stress protein [Herbiconiux ginsengi]SDZ42580.1 Nucleotide-binding universal stress protein, UspA family [Herbiconiux ginsengi]